MDYKMTLEENIAYAKRNIVDLIYKAAKVEGIGVTFPETNELFEGRTIKGLQVEDVVRVNNLKHAWQFVFDTIYYPWMLLSDSVMLQMNLMLLRIFTQS